MSGTNAGQEPSGWQKFKTWRDNDDGIRQQREHQRGLFAAALDAALERGETVQREAFGLLMANQAAELANGYLGRKGLVGVLGMTVLAPWSPLGYVAVTDRRVLVFRWDVGIGGAGSEQAKRRPAHLLWAAARGEVTVGDFRKRAAGTEAMLKLLRPGDSNPARLALSGFRVADGEAVAGLLRAQS
jgi:hypothetical protein